MRSFPYLTLMGGFVIVVTAISLIPAVRKQNTIPSQIVLTAVTVDEQAGQKQVAVQAVDVLKTGAGSAEQEKSATSVYKATGASVAEGLQGCLTAAGCGSYILQDQWIGIGLSLARHRPLADTLDYFVRNRHGRSLVPLSVCRTDPAALLAVNSGKDAIAAEYLALLIEEGNAKGLCVKTTLLDWQRASGGLGDVALPILSANDDRVNFDGTALFRDGIFCGELTNEETTGLLIAADRLRETIQSENGSSFSVTSLHTQVSAVKSEKALQVKLQVDGMARLTESGDPSLTDEQKNARLQVIEQRLCAVVGRALQKTTSAVCDPIELSRRLCRQAVGKGVSEEQMRELLITATVDVNVSLRLTENGLTK